MTDWLDSLDWFQVSNSGNRAMFIANMLTSELQTGNDAAAAGLEAWFSWHDKNRDGRSGFWGSGPSAKYFWGMMGFVHQFIVYNYFDRRLSSPNRIIDRILLLQQPDGLFSPMLGGASCDDLDAIHSLVYFYHTEDNRRAEIKESLRRASFTIKAIQNRDGGFPWSARRRLDVSEWLNLALHNLRIRHPYLLYEATKTVLQGQLHLAKPLRTGWSTEGRRWTDSSIWDTWFRVLALAEIETVLSPEPQSSVWRRVDFPNFGWFLHG